MPALQRWESKLQSALFSAAASRHHSAVPQGLVQSLHLLEDRKSKAISLDPHMHMVYIYRYEEKDAIFI